MRWRAKSLICLWLSYVVVFIIKYIIILISVLTRTVNLSIIGSPIILSEIVSNSGHLGLLPIRQGQSNPPPWDLLSLRWGLCPYSGSLSNWTLLCIGLLFLNDLICNDSLSIVTPTITETPPLDLQHVSFTHGECPYKECPVECQGRAPVLISSIEHLHLA